MFDSKRSCKTSEQSLGWSAASYQKSTIILKLTAYSVEMSLMQPSGQICKLSVNKSSLGIQKNDFQHIPHDTHSVPFKMALIGQERFVYGALAQLCRQTLPKDQVIGWDLGYLLSGRHLLEKVSPRVVQHSNGYFCTISIELLLALYFQYFINMAKTSVWGSNACNLGTPENRLIFCVPHWFSCLSRQRLLDAADIIGMEVEFIDELTLAAYLHYRSIFSTVGMNAGGYSWDKLVVMTENSGNLDVAYFLANQKSMHMIEFAGNVYNYQRDDSIEQIMGSEFKISYYKNRDDPKKRQLVVSGLLQELMQKLPMCYQLTYGQPPMTMLLTGDDTSWETVTVDEGNRHFGVSVDSPVENVNVISQFKGKNLLGQQIDYRTVFEDMNGPYVKTKMPYELMACKDWMGSSGFEKWDVQGDLWVMEVTSSTSRVQIFQMYVSGTKLVLGTVCFPTLLHVKFQKLVIKMKLLAKYQVFQLSGVYGVDKNGTILLEAQKDYRWNTNSVLSAEKKRQLSEVVLVANEYEIKCIYYLMRLRKVLELLLATHDIVRENNRIHFGRGAWLIDGLLDKDGKVFGLHDLKKIIMDLQRYKLKTALK